MASEFRIALIFVPGWSYKVGSPHLAVPLLRGTLTSIGHQVRARDLNMEAAQYYDISVSQEKAIHACARMSLKSLNEPYFDAEDRLMEVAKPYGGKWSAQLGFEFDRYSHKSSADVLEASEMNSPFLGLYKERVIPWLAREKVKMVAISVATAYQLVPAFQLAALLRSTGYDGSIVMGGNTISRLSEEISHNPRLFRSVDAFVVLQGERPLVDLVDAVQKGESLEQVSSTIWHDGHRIRVNRLLGHQDPNTIPVPDFDGLPVSHYWGVNYLPLVASRGCYWGRCSFCSIPYGWGNDGYGGMRRVDLVYADMAALRKKHGIARFKFMDEAATPAFMYKLAHVISQKGNSFEWECYARLERKWLERQFVEVLARSGLKKAYFGLEVIQDKESNVLGKNDHASQLLSILNLCATEGIKTHLFCMFGFPGTTESEARRTTEFILEHRDIIDTVDISAWSYAKHTHVPQAKRIVRENEDWALEYDYEYRSGRSITTKEQVDSMVNEIIDMVWDECPRLLHPTYRLVSPWISLLPVSSPLSTTSGASHVAAA